MRARSLPRSSSRAALAALFVLAGLLSSVPPSVAAPTTLPLTKFFEMEVDGAHEHVFVTGGTGNSSVVVMNYDGTIAEEITGLTSAAGMVLDGTILYVAREGGTTIDKINTETLEVSGSLSIGFAIGGDIELAGGLLWFKRGPCQESGALASLNVETGEVTTHSGSFSCLSFARSKIDANMLLAAESWSSWGHIYRYNVATGSPVVGSYRSDMDLGHARQIVLSPGEEGLLISTEARELRLQDLEPTGFAFPNGAAALASFDSDDDAADRVAKAGGFSSEGRVVFSSPDDPYPLHSVDLPAPVALRGVAFSHDGSRLFAVTTDERFHVVADPLEVSPSTTGGTLPFSKFFEIEVDDANDRVYVTGGTGNGSIAVLDFDGVLLKRITGVPGAAGMVLDGNRLYVGRQFGAGIDIVDVTTLEIVDSHALPFPMEGEMEQASGRLWFKRGRCQRSGPLASFDPVTEIAQSYEGSYYCMTLASNPLDPGMLLASSTGLSPARLTRFDVSGETPAIAVERSMGSSSGTIDFMRQIHVGPSGTTLLMAAGWPNSIQEVRLSDFEPTAATYQMNDFGSPIGVDIHDSDVDRLVTVKGSGEGKDVFIHQLGSSTSIRTFELGEGFTPNDRGVAIDAEAQRLFVVANPGPMLHVFESPLLQPSNLTASLSPVFPKVGQAVTIAGQLTFPNGGSVASKVITVRRDGPAEGDSVTLPQTLTNSSGRFSLQDSPSAAGMYTYRVRWPGDATRGGATRILQTEVGKVAADLQLTSPAPMAPHGATVHLDVTLHAGVEPSNHEVVIMVDRDVEDDLWTWEEFTRVTLDATGRARSSFAASGTWAFQARWSGDGVLPARQSPNLQISVLGVPKVALKRYYKRDGSYYLYHAGTRPKIVGTLIPSWAGDDLFAAIQIRRDGKWKDWGGGWFNLDENGTGFGIMRGAKRGKKYRVLTYFEGSETHLENASAWKYFRITS